MDQTDHTAPLAAARFIKEIGRGKKGARSLSRDDARQLYRAMLERRVSDLELGAIMLAMRIKGESTDELAGFFDAIDASFGKLQIPDGEYAPISIPSYNGARSLPNLTPLLSLMLAGHGVPVLLHGVTKDPGRVTSAEILRELGISWAADRSEAERQLAAGQCAFLPIEALASSAAVLLNMRRTLGVRNSTHTLVKILQPFSTPALRLTSYTHPEYLATLSDYFLANPAHGDAFLMRGTEGETVASVKRAQRIDWFHDGRCTVLAEKQEAGQTQSLPEIGNDAAATAAWIRRILNGDEPVPSAISAQLKHCLYASRHIRGKKNALHYAVRESGTGFSGD